jgi:hypothetical protein
VGEAWALDSLHRGEAFVTIYEDFFEWIDV